MTTPRDSLVQMDRGIWHYEKQPTKVSGFFTTGPAAGFAITQSGGQGSVVTRTGAGIYVVTLADADVVEVVSATACAQDFAGAYTDLVARCEDVTLGVAPTIDLEVYAVAVATDPLTANNLRVHYEITYRRQGQVDPNPLGYYHYVTDATKVMGRVAIGAAGAVGAQNGRGFAVTNPVPGSGHYVITFDEGFNNFQSGRLNAGNGSGAGADLSCNFGAFTAGGAGVANIEVFTNVAAVATDPANGGSISFELFMNSEAIG